MSVLPVSQRDVELISWVHAMTMESYSLYPADRFKYNHNQISHHRDHTTVARGAQPSHGMPCLPLGGRELGCNIHLYTPIQLGVMYSLVNWLLCVELDVPLRRVVPCSCLHFLFSPLPRKT